MGKFAFAGGRLVDGTGAAPVDNSLVLVDDDKITYAGARTEVPAGYEVEDCTGKTIMPGLIDTHLHFSGNLTDDDNDWVIESVAQKQACAVKQSYDCLTHGLTTVCEIGRNGIAIRDLVNMGVMKGPRIYATGLGFCRTAGHGDSHHLPLQVSKDSHPWGDQVDGPWELRHAVRLRLRENPDAIKIWATGGGIWRWDSGCKQLMSTEEIKAVADECKITGIPLWSHSYNSVSAAYDSVRFGAEQLIHGFELDDKTMELMAEQGTFFTPTIGFLPTWYATYPPEETAANACYPGDTVVERELQRTYANLRRANEMASRSPSAPTPSPSSPRTATSPSTRCMTSSTRPASPFSTPSRPLPSTAPRWSTTRMSSAPSRLVSSLIFSSSTATLPVTSTTSSLRTWTSS